MSVPPDPNVYYTGAPPPSYHEAMRGQAPPPGFKPAPIGVAPIPVPIGAHVGPDPMSMQCPNCHMTIETSTKTEPGLIAYISGVLIFLFGFWCGCCLIPCCIDSCMDVHHTCPNCKAYLGRYRR
uniref:LITAF domain-containing protein n=1 Tax=Riptortus pedestris TaxID=329032 RepID=R4WDG1_RIPPE|nr:conserved hypothetical protein [Riptortus pedestris]